MQESSPPKQDHMNADITLSVYQLISSLLFLVFLFYIFRLMEPEWFYKIHKPHSWKRSVQAGEVSNRLKNFEKKYRDKVRLYTIWFQIERLKKAGIKGDFAELGVYKGETAKIIHEMDNSRIFHLFDTFEGFQEEDLLSEESMESKFSSINFSDTSVEIVKQNIEGNSNLRFHSGFFPKSTENIPITNYSFVHLDADLYKPTIAGLKYFYPKLSAGGVIIVHDYNHNWEGVRKAVDEFLQSIPETITELSDWQGSVMIVKNSG